MCNFIIRPIKCYATLDFNSDSSSKELEAGQEVTVKHMLGGVVVVEATNVAKEKYEVSIPVETFVHMFSKDDPKKKKEEPKKS